MLEVYKYDISMQRTKNSKLIANGPCMELKNTRNKLAHIPRKIWRLTRTQAFKATLSQSFQYD